MHATAHDSPFTSSTRQASAEVTSLLPRASRRREAYAAEVTCFAEWIGPAREDWCRGELEVKHSACLDLDIKRMADGALLVSGLPGEETRLLIAAEAIAELEAGAAQQIRVERPGRLRVTLAAAELLPALPAVPPAATIVELHPRRAA